MHKTDSILPRLFENALHENGFLRSGAHVAAACSGGPDSTALFYLLVGLRRKWRLKLTLLHFDHGLRSGSAADAKFVRRMARRARVSFVSGKGAIRAQAAAEKQSLEEAARAARYDFFEREARRRGIAYVALGHTREDQAETTLMRILQGTGLRGLAGIRRSLVRGKVRFIRPLLDFSKQELLKYLREQKLSFRCDKTNASSRFLRNRIRHELLPLLARRFNPRVVEALARLPEIAAAENDLIGELEQRAWGRVLAKSRRPGELALRRSAFLKCPAPLQFRLMNRALRALDAASGIHYEAWKRLAPAFSRARYRCTLPKGIDMMLAPSKLLFTKQPLEVRKKAFAVSRAR